MSDMEITGLPLHPLVVHAAVVLTPLAALAGAAFGLLPAWRWLTRWVLLVTSLSSLAAVAVAKVSGEDLLEARPFLSSAESPVRDLLETHEQRATVLLVAVILFALVAVLAWWAVPAPTGLASGRLDHAGRAEPAWLPRALSGALLVLALVVLVYAALTGDAGARAVWEV